MGSFLKSVMGESFPSETQSPLPKLWAVIENGSADLDTPDQYIERCIKDIHSLPVSLRLQGLRHTLKDIKCMAKLPGGLSRATKHIINIISKQNGFVDAKHRNMPTRVSTTFDVLDETLSRIVAAQWVTLSDLKSANVEQTPEEMLSSLEHINIKLGRGDFGGHDEFQESVSILRCCSCRRLEHTKVMVAVGHVFPPELVDLIWEEVCLGSEAMDFLRGPIVAGWARG
ncbi:hypothetical protein LTR97_011439 [Elasticomyces elasticus]|uniref:Uncharacterized protein n=1 Tax=Elasticomyces elasticus TaxID=574655 RepID=A0AAN7VYL0_9PEZI|nr:hypothetical protein LTR97_011439 [Elasticomyces elasticus]